MVKIIKLQDRYDKLIAGLKKQDRKSQYEFYKMHSPKLLSIIRMYVPDIRCAEELLSNCFVKIFKKIETFDGPSVAIHSWMRTIAVREAIDLLRKKRPMTFPVDELSERCSTDTNPIDDEHAVDHIQAKIDKLPDGYRMVFMLYVIEGYDHEAIARELGINVGTSRSQLYKARKMIRELLAKEDEANG